MAEPSIEDSECHSFEGREASLPASEADDNAKEGNTTGKHPRRQCRRVAIASCCPTLRGRADSRARHGTQTRRSLPHEMGACPLGETGYFNPFGKTQKSRRWIPISERATEVLKTRLHNQSTAKPTRRGQAMLAAPAPFEWVFPSKKATSGHLTTVAKQFREARRLAGLPESLKLYGARHAFATYAVEATGNVFAVADVMGHEDLKTTRIYQHPDFGAIRDAIDQRNRRVM